MELNNSYIDSLAPNASAIKNGKSLAKKSFTKLCISADETLLFGECAGSGKKPYICSMDFLDEANPVPRCSCPSRQIPCKHTLGIMYAYADGAKFEEGEIPEDVTSKRGKIEKRKETKAEKIKDSKELLKPPTKAKITSEKKKIDSMLDGIEMADRLLESIVQTGLGSIDAPALKNINDQIKQLGNYRINGIQTAFNELAIQIKDGGEFEGAIKQILYLQVLLKKSKTFLNDKKSDEQNITRLDTSSAIEEQIGHVWKLEELAAYDKLIENAEIIQLSFYSGHDAALRAYVDEGFFICTNAESNAGIIFTKKNYRPVKAAKYIAEDDTVLGVLEIPQLYLYPGDMNPRGRWDGYTQRDAVKNDYKKIKEFASNDFSATIKAVKNQIKSPLSDKNPVALLKISEIKLMADAKGNEALEITDEKGARQGLFDNGHIKHETIAALKSIIGLAKGNALLVMYENDIASGNLFAKPLSLVTDDKIIRLVY